MNTWGVKYKKCAPMQTMFIPGAALGRMKKDEDCEGHGGNFPSCELFSKNTVLRQERSAGNAG